MDYKLYVHENKINHKRYVGITCKDPKQRWGIDGIKYKSSPHFYSAILKYGWDNFEHVVLIEGLTKELACILEKRFILKWKTNDRRYGYNICDGGEGGPALFGADDPNYGKERTAEHCLHLSQSLQGHFVSEITKQKIRDNNNANKAVVCVETGTVFKSISEASRYANVSPAAICRVLHGGRKTSGNYHWRYAS